MRKSAKSKMRDGLIAEEKEITSAVNPEMREEIEASARQNYEDAKSRGVSDSKYMRELIKRIREVHKASKEQFNDTLEQHHAHIARETIKKMRVDERPYTPPSRVGKKGVLIYLEPEVADILEELKDESGLSVEYLAYQALIEMMRRRNKTIPRVADERLADTQPRRPGPRKGQGGRPRKINLGA